MAVGFPRQGAVPYLFLLLVLLVFHVRSLGNRFHYDDEHSLLKNPHVRSLEALPSFFTDARTFSENPTYAMYRPLVVVTYAFNYALSGYTARGYLAFNLAIHCLATLLVFHLLGQLSFARFPALAGALLFGLHPARLRWSIISAAAPNPWPGFSAYRPFRLICIRWTHRPAGYGSPCPFWPSPWGC